MRIVDGLDPEVYGKCGQSQKAKELLDSMEDLYGVKPTVVVYTCLISGLLRQKKTRPASARQGNR